MRENEQNNGQSRLRHEWRRNEAEEEISVEQLWRSVAFN